MKPNSSTQYEIYENYGTAEYDNSVSQEIFSELKWNGIKTNTEQDPKVKKDIAVIQGLGNFLYGTESTDKEATECLYTIIKYQGKDLLIKLGEGDFDTEMFQNRDIPELRGFLVSTIPLFVIDKRDSETIDGNLTPKNYLNKHAVIVVPQGGGAYLRSSEDMEKKIDLTHIAIRHYDATINAMRTAILRKTFPGVKFKECVKLIKDLQSMSLEDFKKQIGKDKQFLNVEKEEIWLPDLIQCLRNMDAIQDYKSEEEIMLIYNLVHSFSIKEEVFITPIHN